ncbi:MAG: DUF2339 domain-containing protein [Phycisphaerae bacterium]|nr:DUF2339 domain-containing protein [Phycisphaerae bacterium]
MEFFAVLLVFLGIGLAAAGPVAIILAIVLFNKISSIQQRLNRLEGKTEHRGLSMPAVPKDPVWSGQAAVDRTAAKPAVEEPIIPPAQPPMPVQIAEINVSAPVSNQFGVKPSLPYAPAPQPKPTDTGLGQIRPVPTAGKSGWELTIGTTIALAVGTILVIAGVGFFLKYVYEKMLFGPVTRVSMVAVGGIAAIIIGELTRRRGYEIVAKGIAALGFALLYAAVFSGSRVYHLFGTEWAFALSMIITGSAMTYAVVLNEVFIAFLSLLGGYLSPAIITTGRNLPIPLFSYILVLSGGALGCALVRRWRAVNWIAMVGTYLLYTAWFEKFYTAAQIQTALFWLGVFGCIYLVQPVLYALTRKVAARLEDVILIVVNSAVVFYYLWRMLYADYQGQLGLAAAAWGMMHLVLLVFAMLRCRDDGRLQAVLGVLGSAFIAAAIPLYFDALQPSLVGWSVEAIVLTFVSIRYSSLWSRGMAFLTAAVASAGLFYHLPLHPDADFRLVFNAPFGTWIWVSVSILICHALWRVMASGQNEAGRLLTQVYFVWGRLLLAIGAVLEWYAYCDWHIEFLKQGQAYFLMGVMIVAAILLIGFATRPICPHGDFVRMTAVLTAGAGAIFTAMAMMGVYYDQFRMFLNIPFAIACVFIGSFYFSIRQIRKALPSESHQRQMPDALFMLGLLLIFAVISEQFYMYWYCRNQYGPTVVDWKMRAHFSILMAWMFYGLVMLAAGIHFNKFSIRILGVIASGLSAAGLFCQLPLHANGAFTFVFNMPFVAWVVVSAGLLAGHVLWRWMKAAVLEESRLAAQIYYAAGVLLLTAGCWLEWHAHCRWQIEPSTAGHSNLLLGGILLSGITMLILLARPLPPVGDFVQRIGILSALGGAVFTAIAANKVYYKPFILFANIPFAIAVFYAAAMLLGAWFVKCSRGKGGPLPAAIVMASLILLWILLSEEIYWYFRMQAPVLDSWKFLSRMYISVSWAFYAAFLLVIGFVVRSAWIRYLSFGIFAILLGKINLDMWVLGTEYRIATFLTTGLILVGISFLYQFLKKKGFFESNQSRIVELAKVSQKEGV